METDSLKALFQDSKATYEKTITRLKQYLIRRLEALNIPPLKTACNPNVNELNKRLKEK